MKIPTNTHSMLHMTVIPINQITQVIIMMMVTHLTLLNNVTNKGPNTMKMLKITRPLNIRRRRTKNRRSLIIMTRRALSKNQMLRNITECINIRRIRAARPPTMSRNLVSIIFQDIRVKDIVSPPLIMNNRKVLMKNNDVLGITNMANLVFLNKIERFINSRTRLGLSNLQFINLRTRHTNRFTATSSPIKAILIINKRTQVSNHRIILSIRTTDGFNNAVDALNNRQQNHNRYSVTILHTFRNRIHGRRIIMNSMLGFLSLRTLTANLRRKNRMTQYLLTLKNIFIGNLIYAIDICNGNGTVPINLVPMNNIARGARPVEHIHMRMNNTAANRRMIITIKTFVQMDALIIHTFAD